MFLFLLFLACVSVAAAPCHDAEPHLQKRDWHDGDRHCSYRESVVFESLSREFDNGKDPAANLAFGKGKHRSTLYVLDETSVTAVELPGTRGARVGRERKFDVGRVRYKST